MTILAIALDSAVRHVCPDVAESVERRTTRRLTELQLWEELACCVLSSQVRYETATAAVRAMRRARLFAELMDSPSDHHLCDKIVSTLSSPIRMGARESAYRFPHSRATQLVKTRRNLRNAGISLRELVYGDDEEKMKRRRLVDLVCGFGPKQSSMFLRAAGVSYDLAILDRHALRFMQILQLVEENSSINSLSLRRYERLEWRFADYARLVGYPLGYVDWAVWIVMRALAQIKA